MPKPYIESGTAGIPPFVLLHGHGGTEQDLVPIAHFLRPEAPIISLPGQVVEEGKRRYYAHTADGGVDQASLTKATEWLWPTVRRLAAIHRIDLSGVVVLGFSNGANLAANAILTRQVRFRRAILLHPTTLATTDRHLNHVKIFATHGERDPQVPAATFAALVRALAAGANHVTTIETPSGHGLSDAEVKQVRAWLPSEKG